MAAAAARCSGCSCTGGCWRKRPRSVPGGAQPAAYRADTGTVTDQSDKPSGPTAGTETVDALEFLARVVSHIPNKGQVLQRYYG